ncbi:NAD(P)-binding protein [Natronolimnobius sp. AArcel1]|uniref:NAD(P)/FAD-dependent oxidoreductase n=1 Tax=Natronolimnobius sp. AArcel1 TaxID=1679093 RepID=UPI0013E9E684|nr:FAD-dependent oxidoreductase [Natronolimnobius sp. AArcel1]NGM71119.1 NAD(P)-binding protein [Natronolimnobius sp. AArcel1]
MTQIAIVGAGGAGAAAAYALEQRDRDVSITVLEKSGGVCGRAATRRRDELTYDYGANYVKDADERVTELLTKTLETEGLVDISEPIWTFDGDGSISEGRDADEHKWTYREGLTQIAKRLFARTEANVHRRTRVKRVSCDDSAGSDGDSPEWRLEDDDGKTWGPFDRLLLTPPAPQTAELLRAAEWGDRDLLRERLAGAIDDVPYRSIWTGIFHYPFELEVPYYALVNTDKNHEIGWLAREECKPGHVPDGESVLVVQANHEWSLEHFDDPPAETLAELAALTADLLEDDRLADPDWTDHQGWRYAQPDDGVDLEPLRRAEREGLYCLGDWVVGEGRLHAALRSGLECGDRISLE